MDHLSTAYLDLDLISNIQDKVDNGSSVYKT